MITAQKLYLRRGTQALLKEVNFMLHPGWRVGITGRNGSGKSSLFALIRGEITPDAGHFAIPSHWQIAQMAQETPATPQPALEFVMDGDQPLRQLQQQLHEAHQAAEPDGTRIAHLHAQMDAIQGYTAENRAAQLLAGLGFTTAQLQLPVQSFSGGWRMRLNLAQALMCRSDLLLLDEPTNHLDMDAIFWLEQWLRAYPGTLLLISHDRDFLDRVVEWVAHIHGQTLTLYRGNYSQFERTRAEHLAQQQALYTQQQAQIAHIQTYINRFRAQATKARQAQSRLKALERMTLIAAAQVDSPFQFTIPNPEHTPRPLLTLQKVDIGYSPMQPILKALNWQLNPGDRIGLLGRNGAGKSTLIQLLAGLLPPLNGEYTPAAGLQIGYFAQHQLDYLKPEQSALAHLQALAPTAREQTLRDFLGRFGFQGDQALTQLVACFSGGEKARLALALLVWQRPNLLLLDEPTNHLDIEMRAALSLALQDYTGALVVVSHDRYLLRSITDQLYQVHHNHLSLFEGDIDDYQRQFSKTRPETRTILSSNPTLKPSPPPKQNKPNKTNKPNQYKLDRIEQQLTELQQRQHQLAIQLGQAELYTPRQQAQLKQLLLEQTQLQTQLEQLEDEWLQLQAD